jgi:hypothetical protein
VVTADQLYNEYSANSVAADAKYKGKTVDVTGEIQRIGKDFLGSAYVVIGGRGFIDGVQCIFPQTEETVVASLSQRGMISVQGEVSGKMGFVLLRNCRVVYKR